MSTLFHPPGKIYGKSTDTNTINFKNYQPAIIEGALQYFFNMINNKNPVSNNIEEENFKSLFQLNLCVYNKNFHETRDRAADVILQSIKDTNDPSFLEAYVIFVCNLLHDGSFCVSSFIVAILYIENLVNKYPLILDITTWPALLFTSLLLADKMLQDAPLHSKTATVIFPFVSCQESSIMEYAFAHALEYNFYISTKKFKMALDNLLSANIEYELHDFVEETRYCRYHLQNQKNKSIWATGNNISIHQETNFHSFQNLYSEKTIQRQDTNLTEPSMDQIISPNQNMFKNAISSVKIYASKHIHIPYLHKKKNNMQSIQFM